MKVIIIALIAFVVIVVGTYFVVDYIMGSKDTEEEQQDYEEIEEVQDTEETEAQDSKETTAGVSEVEPIKTEVEQEVTEEQDVNVEIETLHNKDRITEAELDKILEDMKIQPEYSTVFENIYFEYKEFEPADVDTYYRNKYKRILLGKMEYKDLVFKDKIRIAFNRVTIEEINKEEAGRYKERFEMLFEKTSKTGTTGSISGHNTVEDSTDRLMYIVATSVMLILLISFAPKFINVFTTKVNEKVEYKEDTEVTVVNEETDNTETMGDLERKGRKLVNEKNLKGDEDYQELSTEEQAKLDEEANKALNENKDVDKDTDKEETKTKSERSSDEEW